MKSEDFRNEKKEFPLTAETPEDKKMFCIGKLCAYQNGVNMPDDDLA